MKLLVAFSALSFTFFLFKTPVSVLSVPDSKEHFRSGLRIEAENSNKQCGVSNAQITMYLQDCSHHHTVYWVQDIPGTCNSRAGIEACSTATVYVENGIVTGHLDVAGICD